MDTRGGLQGTAVVRWVVVRHTAPAGMANLQAHLVRAILRILSKLNSESTLNACDRPIVNTPRPRAGSRQRFAGGRFGSKAISRSPCLHDCSYPHASNCAYVELFRTPTPCSKRQKSSRDGDGIRGIVRVARASSFACCCTTVLSSALHLLLGAVGVAPVHACTKRLTPAAAPRPLPHPAAAAAPPPFVLSTGYADHQGLDVDPALPRLLLQLAVYGRARRPAGAEGCSTQNHTPWPTFAPSCSDSLSQPWIVPPAHASPSAFNPLRVPFAALQYACNYNFFGPVVSAVRPPAAFGEYHWLPQCSPFAGGCCARAAGCDGLCWPVQHSLPSADVVGHVKRTHKPSP